MFENLVRKTTLPILLFSFIADASAVRLSHLSERAEEILYSPKKISSNMVTSVIQKIEEPEICPQMQSINIRNENEAWQHIENSRKTLKNKASDLKRNDMIELSKRIKKLLKLDFDEFPPVSFSYLLDAVEAQL